MKPISDIYKDTPMVVDPRPHKSRRAELCEKIRDEINKERTGTPFKKIDAKYVNIKASHLNVDCLEYLYAICKSAQSKGKPFGKVFFGCVRTIELPNGNK